MYSGEIDAAEELLRESLRLSEGVDRKVGIGRAYWGLGEIAVFTQRWQEVVDWNLRAAEEFLAIDAPFDLGWSWFMVAHAYLKDNMSDKAAPYLERALDIFAASKDLSALTLVFDALSLVAVKRDDRARAARLIGAADRLKADTGVAITEVEANQFPGMEEFRNGMLESDEAAYEEGRRYTVEEAIACARGAVSS
jgi:tetratricopeptide (TPR) repeat protein